MTIKKKNKPFGVGELVNVPIGTRRLRGKVAEDRGKIGVQGRKLYRIAVTIDGEVMFIELPADQIRRAGGRITGRTILNAAKTAKALKKSKTV